MKEYLESIQYIRFTTPKQFYDKRKLIKQTFREMDIDTAQLFKQYFFYQFCLLKNPTKLIFWDYLCGVVSESEIEMEYNNFRQNVNEIREKERKWQGK